MTLPADIHLDLHQDGLRLSYCTDRDAGELLLYGPVGEMMGIPLRYLPVLRGFLTVLSEAVAGRA